MAGCLCAGVGGGGGGFAPVVLGGGFFHECGVGGLRAGGAVCVEGADGKVGVVDGDDLAEAGGKPGVARFVKVEVLRVCVHCCCVGWLGVVVSVVGSGQQGRAAGCRCQMSSRRGAVACGFCSPLWMRHALRSVVRMMCARLRTAELTLWPSASIFLMCSAGSMRCCIYVEARLSRRARGLRFNFNKISVADFSH